MDTCLGLKGGEAACNRLPHVHTGDCEKYLEAPLDAVASGQGAGREGLMWGGSRGCREGWAVMSRY